ncbi:hypothetical protein NGB58_25985 [Escherichia coli]|nr:hypothetical protein [Escherichia coli]
MNIKNIAMALLLSFVSGSVLAYEVVMGNCELTNGKTLSVWASDGGRYNYTLYGKNDSVELDLKEGLFGVKAFHHYHPVRDGVGAFKYLRFNKGEYDYVVISYEDGQTPYFDGVVVFRNGTRIARLPCVHPFSGSFTVETLPANNHLDSDDMAEYILYNFR